MLYLIRHGETEWNRLGRIQGGSDIPLSPEGEAQAMQLGYWLRDLTLHRVIASDLSRARRTAELLVGGRVPVFMDERLRERSFGPFEGWTLPEILTDLRNRFSPVSECFDPVETWPAGAGVEPLEDVLVRSGAVVEGLQEEASERHIALVTHGNVVHVLVRHLLRFEGRRSIRLPNCCCIELEARKGRWMLRSFVSPGMLGGSLA